MVKRIQPELHNNRVHLDTMAYFYAAMEAAEALLGSLWLANERGIDGYPDARDIHLEDAAKEASVLLDYSTLHGGGDGPDYYLRGAIVRDEVMAPHLDQALQMVAVPVTPKWPRDLRAHLGDIGGGRR